MSSLVPPPVPLSAPALDDSQEPAVARRRATDLTDLRARRRETARVALASAALFAVAGAAHAVPAPGTTASA